MSTLESTSVHQGSRSLLTLARAPPNIKEDKQQRLMRIWRVVSHQAIRLAPSPPEARAALPVTTALLVVPPLQIPYYPPLYPPFQILYYHCCRY